MEISPRNKTGGIVTNTILGVGGLIVAVIVILVITSTLIESDVLGTSVQNNTVINEAGGINMSNILGGVANSSRSGYQITRITNTSDDVVILSANYTVDSATGILSNLTSLNYDASIGGGVSINYSYDTVEDSLAQDSVDELQGNFTSGIQNISEKIPTILLIVAVVFLFGALILLIRNARGLGIGGEGDGGSSL